MEADEELDVVVEVDAVVVLEVEELEAVVELVEVEVPVDPSELKTITVPFM